MSGHLRIALAQPERQPVSLEESLALVSKLMAEAADGGADFLMLPELALSGYGNVEQTRNLAISLDEATDCFREIAARQRVGLLVGYAERYGGGIANSAIMLDAKGERLLNYRKMHLWGEHEETVFTPGRPGDLVDLPYGIKAGVLICFDLDHPVTAQDLASRGADVIFVLTATSTPYEIVPIAQVPARAYENAVFVVFCNWAGSQNGIDFVGLSTVAAPDGSVIARAGNSPGLIFADLNPSSFEDYRRLHNYSGKLRRDLFPTPQHKLR